MNVRGVSVSRKARGMSRCIALSLATAWVTLIGTSGLAMAGIYRCERADGSTDPERTGLGTAQVLRALAGIDLD